MMHGMRMLLVAGALAACGPADGDEAAPPAPPARPAEPARPAASQRVDSVAVGRYRFVLHRRPTGMVDSVFVTRSGKRVQTLVPSELEEFTKLGDPTYLVDLDFDGHMDFGLMTLMPAGPNARYDYWRYEPAASRFRYVGNYHMFEPDSAQRVLYVSTRDGHAGQLWTNERWRWTDGRPMEVWRTQQTYAEDLQRYVNSESELRDGQWVVVRADTLANCEADPVSAEECPQAAVDHDEERR